MRGRDKDFGGTEKTAAQASVNVAAYRSIKPLSANGEKALKQIEGVINLYLEGARRSKKLWTEGKTIPEIDGSVK